MEMPLPVIALESFRHCTTPKPPHVRPLGHPLHPNPPYIYEHGIFALMTLLKSKTASRKVARATRLPTLMRKKKRPISVVFLGGIAAFCLAPLCEAQVPSGGAPPIRVESDQVVVPVLV